MHLSVKMCAHSKCHCDGIIQKKKTHTPHSHTALAHVMVKLLTRTQKSDKITLAYEFRYQMHKFKWKIFHQQYENEYMQHHPKIDALIKALQLEKGTKMKRKSKIRKNYVDEKYPQQKKKKPKHLLNFQSQ